MPPSRTKVNVSLRGPIKSWVERQVKAGDYPTPDAFVNHVLRLARENQRDLEALLLDGLNSGPSRPLDDAAWKRIERASKTTAQRLRRARERGKAVIERRKSA